MERNFSSHVLRRGELWADIRDGTRSAALWTQFARLDIKNRYRRSWLGPFWITLNTIVLIACLGPLYAMLFKQDIRSFFPHVCLGIIFWEFISITINDLAAALPNSTSYMNASRLPLSVPIFRVVLRNCIYLLHTLPVYLPVAIYGGIKLAPAMLLFIPGLLLVVVFLLAFGFAISIASVRFRDVELIMRNMLTLFFFISPVVWKASMLPPEFSWIAYVNPVGAALDVMRAPLEGNLAAPLSYVMLLLGTAGALMLASAQFMYFKRKVNYWI